ncbi:MAG: ferritin family protein [Deltaproteobacteria bacterium]|nr:ferritin family protein [Deltaproteobacteria bacterium]
MAEFYSFEEIVKFAIAREIEANQFYLNLADRLENPAVRELLVDFAAEEMEHKARLELEIIKKGKTVATEQKQIELDINNYLVDAQLQQDMDYAEILQLAIRKERASFRLYANLATIVEEAQARQTLLALAEEEARHMVRFETEYNEMVLKEK